MSKVESFQWNKLSNKNFSFESEQFFFCVLFQLFSGVALITLSICHCCVVRQKEFSRKVEISKVESFYWNKLSNKSFSFASEQFFYLCFLSAIQGSCWHNIEYIPLLCFKTKGIFQEI